ncbi:MAG: DUF1565 domain-containing protein, partial [Casimicrobiaceae bacterium]
MKLIVVALIAFVMSVMGPVMAADWHVSGTGSDLTGNGSSVLPFRTITMAMNGASNNDVIKVHAGTYTVLAGEVFPIDIKYGVDILGQEMSTASYPQVGGDVNDSGVEALFHIDARSASRTNTQIKFIRFVAEDSAGKDAPSALLMQVAGGYSSSSNVMESCIVERSEMHLSGGSGRAALLFDAGYGTLDFEVKTCTINASTRGGVEVEVGTSADSTAHESVVQFTLRGTTVQCLGDEVAEFGVRYGGVGLKHATFHTSTLGCAIDSTQVSNSSCGAANGLVLEALPT